MCALNDLVKAAESRAMAKAARELARLSRYPENKKVLYGSAFCLDELADLFQSEKCGLKGCRHRRRRTRRARR
jgi:hypothetical protein